MTDDNKSTIPVQDRAAFEAMAGSKDAPDRPLLNDPRQIAMEHAFDIWFGENERMMEAGFDVDFDQLRLALNAAFANSSKSAD
ncbi:MAG: hypothetical protein WAW96_12120 [Alphaproteobacteria bacterium]